MTTHTLPPEVKVLLWEQPDGPDGTSWLAHGTDWCQFYIRLVNNEWMLEGPQDNSEDATPHKTLDEAKAAAQADYNARILSALEPSGEGVGAEPVAWRYRDSRDDRSKWTVQKNPPHWAGQPGWERYTIEPLYAQPLSGMEGVEGALRDFDVQSWIDDYEFRGDEGDYRPNPQERELLIDAAEGLRYDITQAVRATLSTPVSAASPEGEGAEEGNGWFKLGGDTRLGACATNGCGGQPTWRLERGGVGSDYCSGCAATIRGLADVQSHAPEGFVLVPVEPTEAMALAAVPHLFAAYSKEGARPIGQFWPGQTADESEQSNVQYYGPQRAQAAYRAMLAAAPATQEKNRG